jgi:hypothetical protein
VYLDRSNRQQITVQDRGEKTEVGEYRSGRSRKETESLSAPGEMPEWKKKRL